MGRMRVSSPACSNAAGGASLRRAGSSEQAPSFDVVTIIVSCAMCAGFFGFFRIETCLHEIHQIFGQDQEAAVRKFPRADIELSFRPV